MSESAKHFAQLHSRPPAVHYGNNKAGHVLSSHLALVALEKCVSRYSMAFLVAKALQQQQQTKL